MNLLKVVFITIFFITGIVLTAITQSNNELQDFEYRRSSLHLVLIESENFPHKETVINAYFNAPFPDNYNDHRIEYLSFNPADYPVTQEERQKAQEELYADSDAEPLSEEEEQALTESIDSLEVNSPVLASFLSETSSAAADIPVAISKFFEEKKIANKLVAKWFNRKEDGSFDMNLIGKRGQYNASEMDAHIATGTARGLASLADAGEELIKNTFVVVNQLFFIRNEPLAAATRDIALAGIDKIESELAREITKTSANLIYEKSKDGYSVLALAYLYQLNWNDSVAAVFYNDLWMSENNIEIEKKQRFDTTELFQLNLIGGANARGRLIFSGDRDEKTIIETVTVRTIDNVYVRLQKEFDVFKPKVPLLTSDPITAKIGMKEGIEGGERFEVLEQVLDSETGLTKYEKVGTVRVNRSEIWDNRYNAGEVVLNYEQNQEDDNTEINRDIDRTTFRGRSRNLYPGMLIRME